MEQIIKQTIQKLSLPEITFADVRITRTDNEGIFFQNGFLRGYSTNLDSIALGIRVLINGCWGFAGTRDLSSSSIDKAIHTAISNAHFGSLFQKTKVEFPPLSPVQAEYEHHPEQDPFKMAKEEKIDYLQRLAEAIKPQEKIVHSIIYAAFMRQEKYYANSEGTYAHYTFYNTLPMM